MQRTALRAAGFFTWHLSRIQQISTGEVQYYLLPALPTDSDTLPGVVDKTGFLP